MQWTRFQERATTDPFGVLVQIRKRCILSFLWLDTAPHSYTAWWEESGWGLSPQSLLDVESLGRVQPHPDLVPGHWSWGWFCWVSPKSWRILPWPVLPVLIPLPEDSISGTGNCFCQVSRLGLWVLSLAPAPAPRNCLHFICLS